MKAHHGRPTKTDSIPLLRFQFLPSPVPSLLWGERQTAQGWIELFDVNRLDGCILNAQTATYGVVDRTILATVKMKVVLRGPSGLSAAEPEIIAAYVFMRNQCAPSAGVHEETAAALGQGPARLRALINDLDTALEEIRLRPLFRLAETLTKGNAVTIDLGKLWTEQLVACWYDPRPDL